MRFTSLVSALAGIVALTAAQRPSTFPSVDDVAGQAHSLSTESHSCESDCDICCSSNGCFMLDDPCAETMSACCTLYVFKDSSGELFYKNTDGKVVTMIS